MKSDFIKHLEKAVAKLPGYADGDDWPDAPEMAEIQVVKDLYKSLGLNLGQGPSKIIAIKPDPPDVLVITSSGKRIGYELTQLRDGKYTAFHREAKKKGPPPGLDEFDLIRIQSKWGIDRIKEESINALKIKDKKLALASLNYDEIRVIIHTCEPDICNHKALQASQLIRPVLENIDSAWLIIDDEPARKRRTRSAFKLPIVKLKK